MGIFREMGLVNPDTPIVTTIHSLQVKEDERVVMDAHDTPLDWIITPEEVIETKTMIAQPGGVNWDTIQSDQYENIPFLLALKSLLLDKKSS